MKGKLNAAGVPGRVIVDVEVGCLVKSMEEGSGTGRGEVTMHVDKTVNEEMLSEPSGCMKTLDTHTVANVSSPGKGGMLSA
jgi:hypothetical protein